MNNQRGNEEPTQEHGAVPRRTEVFTSAEMRSLTRRAWGPPMVRLGAQTLLYAAVVALPFFVDSWWLRVPAWIMAGIILAGLHSILHYCCHGTFVPGTRGNRVFGQVAGSLVLMNSALYRAFHLTHHRLTGEAGDPEPDGAFTRLRQYAFAMLNVDYIVAFARMSVASLWHRYPDFVRSPRERRAIRRDSLLLVAWVCLVAGATFLWPWVVLNVYLIPLVIAGTVNFLSALPEHYYAERSGNPWRNTNSVYTRSVWFRFLYWNSNYHAEHHLFPGVPSWRLPQVSKRVKKYLSHTETSYVAFHRKLLSDLASGRAALEEQPIGEGRRADFWYPLNKVADANPSTGADVER